MNTTESSKWGNHIDLRIKYAAECEDIKYFTKVPDSGKIIDNYQIMFNGIKVTKDGYCGEWMTELIRQCGGLHEPQEEKAFSEVLKRMPDNAVMLEIGCYWAWYSMWFNKEVSQAKNYLVDCEVEYIEVGKQNFLLNEMFGSFELNRVPEFKVSEFMIKNDLEFLNILHADIQGYELNLLLDCVNFFNKIGYIFVSTHSDELHKVCLEILSQANFIILCQNSIIESCSVDGFIVAKNPNIDIDFNSIDVSKGHYTY